MMGMMPNAATRITLIMMMAGRQRLGRERQVDRARKYQRLPADPQVVDAFRLALHQHDVTDAQFLVFELAQFFRLAIGVGFRRVHGDR